MGSASSKNEAKELATIVNDISQLTTTDNTNVETTWNNTIFTDCNVEVGKDFSVSQAGTNYVKAVQLASALQNSNVVNDISQKLAQQALAKMGFLGVGFASASNSASTTANATNTIINAMTTTLNNITNVNNNFTCDSSTIKVKGDFVISQEGFNTIMSDQTVQNSQITDLSNTLTQDVSQKASATVQGAIGFLLLLILLIGVIAYAFSKPLNTAAGKTVASGVMAFGLIILLVWMATVQAPPLFTPPTYVYPYAFSGQNGTCPNTRSQIVEVKKRTLSLKIAPLMFNYPIYKDTTYSPYASLLSLIVAQQLGNNTDSNRGYNALTAKKVNETFAQLLESSGWYNTLKSKLGIDMAFPDLMQKCQAVKIPNGEDAALPNYVDHPGSQIYSTQCADGPPPKCGDDKDCNDNAILALPNVDGFQTYCSDRKRAMLARFVFAYEFGFQCNYFVDDNQPVAYLGDDGVAHIDLANQVDAKYVLRIINVSYADYKDPIPGSVTVESEFGICTTPSYTIGKNFKTWGIAITVIITVLIILFIIFKSMMFAHRKNKEATSATR